MNNDQEKNHNNNELDFFQRKTIIKFFSFICFFLAIDAMIKIFYFYEYVIFSVFFFLYCIVFLYFGWKLMKSSEDNDKK